MHQQAIIVVTGAVGFIGSCLVARLNELGYEQLILVDDFSRIDKAPNLLDKKFIKKIHRDQFIDWWEQHPDGFQYLFHLGARTDTSLQDDKIFKELNIQYSQQLWQLASSNAIPMVYASSAATYGDGSLGYDDNMAILPALHPLNPYGNSKHIVDKWVLKQSEQPPFWAGLKFFNVYGPNEYHKGRMASVIMHAFNQIQSEGSVKLFKSHKPAYVHGGQQRDFVYVKDVVNICIWLMQEQPHSGIYNVGSGQARSFNDLANAVFKALAMEPAIEYIDTPADIRDSYQYFTEANMDKLKNTAYPYPFFSLEEGVMDYIQQYLVTHKIY